MPEKYGSRGTNRYKRKIIESRMAARYFFKKRIKKDLEKWKCNRFCNWEGVKYITEVWGIPPIDKGEVHYEKAFK